MTGRTAPESNPRRSTGDRSSVHRLLRRTAVAAVVTFALGLALSVLARLDALSDADDDLTADIHRWSLDHPTVHDLAGDVTIVGNPLTLAAIVAVVGIWLLAHRRLAITVWLVVMTALGGAVESALKVVVGRSRPDLDTVTLEPTSKSFPSGHAFNTTTVFGAVTIALVVAATSTRARVVPVAAAAAAVVAVLVGLTRPLLGVHFTSDVLAGWILASVWLVLGRPDRRADAVSSEPADPEPAPPSA